MARSNVIEFARSFQESFQRQQQIELQRQREERFDRQLTANADFQQSQANIQQQQFVQRELRLTGQAEVSAGFRERQLKVSEGRFGLETKRFEAGDFGKTFVNTPRFFEQEFGFSPEKAQVSAEIARGIRPKGIDRFSSLELTRMAEVLQNSFTPEAFKVGQELGVIAAGKIQQELKQQTIEPLKSEFAPPQTNAEDENILKPQTQEDFDAIPKGTEFIDTDGQRKVKR